jgi:hypothetical protein
MKNLKIATGTLLFLSVLIATVAELGLLSPSLVRTSPVLAQLPQVSSQAENNEEKPEEVVDTEANTPVVPDTGVDNVGVVDPVVTEAQAGVTARKISDKAILETQYIALPTSNKPGQISTQDHICQITVWQDPSTAPAVTYGAYVICPLGTPSNIQLMLERSNVNTPYNYLLSSKAPTHNCFTGAICLTPTYKHTVSGTKHLHATAIATIIGTYGEVVGTPKVRVTWHYNDKGAAYPRIRPPQPWRFEMVPFPDGPPWDRYLFKRDKDFPLKLEAEYTKNGWTMPTGQGVQAHHIKPLSHGGNNDLSNGVFLDRQQHQPFTTWWRSFNARMW